LVGGFPCQDYSVATTLKNSKGLVGKKGVLWWSIHRILKEKKKKPGYLILENVDRLLKSPSNQRGRDFAIMLKCLGNLGYGVEWRVINAADYGMPQRRRRVFIIAIHSSTKLYASFSKNSVSELLYRYGFFSSSFPVQNEKQNIVEFPLNQSLQVISESFNKGEKLSPFQNSGVYINDLVSTVKTSPSYDGSTTTISKLLQKNNIGDEYFISPADLPKWEYLKGAKKEVRTTKDGFKYNYTEGSMIFPDALDKPSRTIITGEGGKSPSRFKHVVNTKKGLRRLTPIELERLNMFPDNHTKLEGISDTKRAFFMGNALVVGIVEKIGATLLQKISEECL
jgi:DNA (cytosine-5)-methyltransferase 1